MASPGSASVAASNALPSEREIAVRRSLGASRSQLVRQLATEHALLFGLGTVTGLVLTFWALEGLPLVLALLPIPARLDAVMTPGVLAFAVALLVAWVPARRAARTEPAVVLRVE